jgi:hypothetical protein
VLNAFLGTRGPPPQGCPVHKAFKPYAVPITRGKGAALGWTLLVPAPLRLGRRVRDLKRERKGGPIHVSVGVMWTSAGCLVV